MSSKSCATGAANVAFMSLALPSKIRKSRQRSQSQVDMPHQSKDGDVAVCRFDAQIKPATHAFVDTGHVPMSDKKFNTPM